MSAFLLRSMAKYAVFLSIFLAVYVLGAQKNHLIEMVLLSTNNIIICFVREVKKLLF